MTVFDKECGNIINDLSSDSGFFPISQIGSWHSGIHINLDGMVACPVTGTIIDCNFSDMETSNYFVIESAITNKNQTVSYYSIISAIKSYKEMKEYFESKKNPDTSACPLNEILNYFTDKGLPYGVKAKLHVKNYKSSYVTICGEQKILGSFFYLNSNTNTSSTEDGTITERFVCGGKVKIQVCKDNFGFINGNIICEDYTIAKGAEVSLSENNTLRVKGSLNITNNKFKFEKTLGFFDLKRNGKTIGRYGNISFKGNERIKFYEKKESFTESISLIDKAQLERISLLTAEIKSEIFAKENYEILRSGQETPAEERQYEIEESDEREKAKLLKKELEILKKVKDFLEKEDDVAIVSKRYAPIDFYPMNISSHNNISKNLNVCIKYGTGNFAIYTADENLIVVDKFFLEVIKNSKNKLDLKELPNHKEIRIIKKREFDKHITGLKTIVDGQEQNSRSDCYNGKSVCECRPYMFNDGYTYDFKVNEGQKKLVFLKYQITGWVDDTTMKKDGIYVYSQDNQTFPSKILESDEEILAIETAKESVLKITLRSGIAYCGRDDSSLQVEFSDDSDFIGKTISKGTYLGNANAKYVDWAMFFKENIIDELKKMKRQQICIPRDTACRKKVYVKHHFNLPQDTTIQLDDNKIELVNADLVLKFDQAEKGEIEVASEGNQTECAFTKKLSRLYIRTLGQYVNVECKSETPLAFEIKESGSTLNKKFHDYINMVLKKIVGGWFKCELQHNKIDFYVVRVELTASDIAEFYGMRQPVCIEEDSLESARKKTDEIKCELVIFNGGIIETEDCASLSETYEDHDYHDGKYEQVKLGDANGIAKDYFEITQGNEIYYIDTEILNGEGVVTDYVKEYCDSLIPLNFGSSIADENVCPAVKSLACNLLELKEKLKDIDLPNGKGKLEACLDKKQSNYLYRPDCIDDSYPVQALSSRKYKDAVLYTSKFVSRHPMEFDKGLYDRCCSDLGLCSDPSESHDIYKRIKDRLHVSENSFYFLYPPDFMSMLDDARLLEFNPYEGMTYAALIRGKRDQLLNNSIYESLTVKSNPGLCTLYDETVDDKNDYIVGSDKKKYAKINGFFNADYKEYYSRYKEYRHEGIDFRGPKGRVVYSLITGKILDYGERPNNKGGVILIQSINKPSLYYMALHVDINSTKNEYKLKKDDFVYPGMPIAKTMDMASAHLHVSVFKLNENTSYIHNIIDSNFYLLYFNKSNWKYTINPFDYDDENTWKGWEQ